MWNTHTRAPKHFGYHTLDCNNLLVTSSGAKTPVEIRRAGKSAAYCDLVWKSIRTYTHKCDTYVWDYMSAIYLYFWAGCLGVQITYIHGLHILCTYVASESFEHRILFAASTWISFSKFFYSIFGSRTIEFVSWNVPFKWGHEKLQILLEAWEASKGEWSSSQLYKTITQRKTTTCHGARVWLTRTQIASKYQDQSIADCICDAKLADKELAASQTKWHPDGVGIEARWYWWYGFGKSRH